MGSRRYVPLVALLAAALPLGMIGQAGAAAPNMTLTATAYGPSLQDNYPYGPVDMFGKPLVSGDVAVDPSVIPIGTCLYVSGYQSPNLPSNGFVAVARDTGGAIKGRRIDLFLNGSSSQVSNFGVQQVNVKVLGRVPADTPQQTTAAACRTFAAGNQGSGSGTGNGQGTAPSQSEGTGSSQGSGQAQSQGAQSGQGGQSGANTVTTTTVQPTGESSPSTSGSRLDRSHHRWQHCWHRAWFHHDHDDDGWR